ncbi:5-oxoprolinase subunit PxpB [Paenibacillus spongiae]|uniref:5-oxoprolinase subunit PxpB n=1 Tax=Paenibacillus spongiae TaxID=2909671 RepID=A0ABY5S7P7_9BACL|nr:5-oxoprolinase subunit PxpB [Paenibacillus spongiae]UVI28728.1 5-oxoprolinase subunit PxpB [Paenibacillus spongiae]
MQPQIAIAPLGDRALVVRRIGAPDSMDAHAMAGMAERLRAAEAAWIIDVVPAIDTLTVVYEPLAVMRLSDKRTLPEDSGAAIAHGHRTRGEPPDTAIRYEVITPFAAAEREVRQLLAAGAYDLERAPRIVEIPVRYGGVDGPDLAEAAMRSGLSTEAFIVLHASVEYEVAMIGFMPGFPYLKGLPPRLAQPRLASPRRLVPAGSVGIGGGQTGIYPLETPGGWRLIGRTQVKLFDPNRDEPSLLRAGDKLRFVQTGSGDMGAGGGA